VVELDDGGVADEVKMMRLEAFLCQLGHVATLWLGTQSISVLRG
jgi:hypothetical protein